MERGEKREVAAKGRGNEDRKKERKVGGIGKEGK